MAKTILVTGGAGYIGSHTVKQLISADYNVIVLDSMESGHEAAVDPKATLEIVDTKNKNDIDKLFKKYKIDAVIDFAAYLAVGESMENPKKYFENNVRNFVNLLEVMKDNGCKYLIKSSTAATYGNPTKDSDIPWLETFTNDYQPKESALLEGIWEGEKVVGEEFFQKFIQYYKTEFADKPEIQLTEADETKLRIPMSIYGLSKLLDEILMNRYNELCGLNSIALRYFNVCGADPSGEIGDAKPKPTNLMSLAIMSILGKAPKLQVFGDDYPTPDGTAIRDYIHPGDLAVGHQKALEYFDNFSGFDNFNLGTGNGSSVLEVIAAVENAAGKKVEYDMAPRRSGDPSISVANSSKANKILNWQARYSLDDMAKTAWDWHSKNPEGFVK